MSGDEVFSPIDADTWDVEILDALDTPVVRRCTRDSKKTAAKDVEVEAEEDGKALDEEAEDECGINDSDDSDFVRRPAQASTRAKKGSTSKEGGGVDDAAAKRRRLNYDNTAEVAESEDCEEIEKRADAAQKRGKGQRGRAPQQKEEAAGKGGKGFAGGKGAAGVKGAAAGKGTTVHGGCMHEDAMVISSEDDFATMQPKKSRIRADQEQAHKKGAVGKAVRKSKCAGKGKEGKEEKKGKEPVYVCERGCGFEGQFSAVQAHEQVCGYVRGDQWESDMDSGEEEEFLHKWEASVERQLQNKKEAPPGLLMPLLPFQRESLAWMCEQEDSKYKGGILADEMGMGKTIQAISLIMTNRAKQEGVVKSTLVVCPLVAMVQWRGEIERYCAAGSLSLTIYHGPKRVTDPKELLKYDVVLTTYAIVQSEFSALSKAHKVTCKYCNKKYLPPQLIIHHKFFCGPNAQRSAALAKTDKKVSSGALS